MEVHKNKNGGIMVKKVILYLLTMIFALSTATALAAEPADAPVSMRERMEKIRVPGISGRKSQKNGKYA